MNGLCGSLHSWYTSLSLNKSMHFSIYMSMSMMDKATPLSTVRIIWLSSFLRLCRAFLFLVMLENISLGLAVNFLWTSLVLA